MTYYERFQLEKYGNIIPSEDPIDQEFSVNLERIEFEQQSFEFTNLSDNYNPHED